MAFKLFQHKSKIEWISVCKNNYRWEDVNINLFLMLILFFKH